MLILMSELMDIIENERQKQLEEERKLFEELLNRFKRITRMYSNVFDTEQIIPELDSKKWLLGCIQQNFITWI